jgi:hypothetical protein
MPRKSLENAVTDWQARASNASRGPLDHQSPSKNWKQACSTLCFTPSNAGFALALQESATAQQLKALLHGSRRFHDQYMNDAVGD